MAKEKTSFLRKLKLDSTSITPLSVVDLGEGANVGQTQVLSAAGEGGREGGRGLQHQEPSKGKKMEARFRQEQQRVVEKEREEEGEGGIQEETHMHLQEEGRVAPYRKRAVTEQQIGEEEEGRTVHVAQES